MSETVTIALIGVTLIVFVLFWLASAHYVGEVLEDLGDDTHDDHGDHGGHGGAGH